MAAPKLGKAWSKLKEKTWEDWALNAAIGAGGAYLAKNEWRRGLRNVGATGQSSGRFAGAAYRSLGDFFRANARGNQPFAVEPYIAPGVLLSVMAVTPVVMLIQSQTVPHIAGPMQQSAATGQPGIGRVDTSPASSWDEFFSWDFWGVH